MTGQPDGDHKQTDMEYIGQRPENRVFGHVFVDRQQPPPIGGEDILPAEMLVDDLVGLP